MLVFVDESEWPRPGDPNGYTVWAGAAIDPHVSKHFFREVFNLEKKFWKVNEPYEFEIKGRLLLNRRAMTSPKHVDFAEELLTLCKRSGIVAFAVGMKPPTTAPLPGIPKPDRLFRVNQILLERVEQMMVEMHPDDMAIIAFDSQDLKKDTNRSLQFGNFLYGHSDGKAMQHVVETPYFVSSSVTVGIQIADLIAYALAQSNMGRNEELRMARALISDIEWRSNRTDVEYPMRGFRFIN